MTHPPPPGPCHCLAIRQAARKVTQLYDRHLVPAGLRATQYAVLMAICRNAPLALNELARVLVMDRTAVSRALRPLERDGLVRIGPGRDARTRALDLTAAGEARLRTAHPMWLRAQRDFEAQFGPAETDSLRLSLAGVVART